MAAFEPEDEKKARSHYAFLVINKTYRSGLGILCTFYYMVCFGLIYQMMLSHHSWTTIALPIGALGLMFLVYPPTEQWHYSPWQTRPQKLERHYRG